MVVVKMIMVMRVMMMMMMMMMIIIANFKLNYECNIKYEDDFKTNQVTRTLTFPVSDQHITLRKR